MTDPLDPSLPRQVLGHCIEGVSPAALALLSTAQRPAGAAGAFRPPTMSRPGFQLDAAVVQSMVEMGFSQVSGHHREVW